MPKSVGVNLCIVAEEGFGDPAFWRIDPRADYGKLNVVSQHRLKPQRIEAVVKGQLRPLRNPADDPD
jgi:hypothetical protein